MARVLVLRTGQNGVAHKTPQACKPKAVAMAVNNVMVILRILLQIVLLFSFSIVFRFMIFGFSPQITQIIFYSLLSSRGALATKDLECIAQLIPLKKGV